MRKNVLICIPDLGICNGVTSFIMSFYDCLLQCEYVIDFLLVSDKNMEMEPYVRERGSKVFVVPKASKYDKKRIGYIDEVFKNGEYDIVHVNFPGPNGAMVLKAAKKHGVKHRIYHCHNPLNMLSVKSALSESVFTPICRKRANKYVACSSSAGKSIFGNAEFEIVNNAIDPQKYIFKPEARVRIREELNIEDRLVVGVAARMAAQKNPSFIIKVFNEIKKIRDDAVLLWIGDGIMHKQIQELCTELGIADAVLLVGRQAAVDEWYSAMDLFLLPSKYEGLGIVYLEAQANGLLCFGSECVPEETEVTELMHRISLDKGASEWAAEILRIYEEQPEKHKVDIDLFEKCGYNIETVKHRLCEVYDSFYDE